MVRGEIKIMPSKFTDLMWKTIVKIENLDNKRLIFHVKDERYDTDDIEIYMLHHTLAASDCEDVYIRIESITGDLEDLIGSPILFAAESMSAANYRKGCPTCSNHKERCPSCSKFLKFSGVKDNEDLDGCHICWTFYKLATVKGYIDIRWNAVANHESFCVMVDFTEISKKRYDGIIWNREEEKREKEEALSRPRGHILTPSQENYIEAYEKLLQKKMGVTDRPLTKQETLEATRRVHLEGLRNKGGEKW